MPRYAFKEGKAWGEHRRKWDNTIFIVLFTFLNAGLVNHIGFSSKSGQSEKCARSLYDHAFSATKQSQEMGTTQQRPTPFTSTPTTHAGSNSAWVA